MSMTTAAEKIRNFIVGGSALRRHLVRAAAGSLALSLSSKMLMLLTSVLLARWLGAEGYGYYVSSMAVLTLLSIFATIGFPTLVIRLFSSYRAHQKWGLMRGLLERSNQLILVVSIALGGAGAVIISAMSENLAPSYTNCLWWAMAMLPLVALGAIRSALLRGLHFVVLGQLSENLLTPGLFVLFISAWAGLTLSSSLALTPEAAMASRFAAVAISFLVGAWLLVKRLPEEIRSSEPRYEIKEWTRSALPLLFIVGIGIIGSQVNMLMLSGLQSAESAGIYQIATRGGELVAFSLVVVNMAIQPTISKLYSLGEVKKLQRVLTIAARGTLALAVPLAVIMGFFAEPILGTVFGPEFKRGALSLTILCVAQVIAAASGSVGQILYMTGHERDASIGVFVGFAVNITSSLILIPLWDIAGAATASALSIVSCNLVLAFLVRKRTGLNSTAF
ncbi:flippase [Pseudomonas sp. CCC3.1]|uniref:flippase n=1 Tax=Pseudomonas sp. CCC3.1 TaxID=3048607 RepID=UPI002AC9CEB5|nr:flippase [Pseudomonas sp. CCC3.1]MEB0205864.1 flippase [Pseudomonas sp. CCC3.1]WPX34553.1 flippase [Pseudomonas sp. CCC3.1]